MVRTSILSSWLAWGVAVFAALLLVAGPIAPAVAAPMDCCPDASCHDMDKSACPQACVVACPIIAEREHQLSEPIRHDAPRATPESMTLPPGRDIVPDLPPPR